MKSIIPAAIFVSIGLAACEQKPANAVPEQTATIQRTIETPSGDWIGIIDYTYGEDGSLRSASYEFRTFTGYEADEEEFKPTRCVREYDASESGELILRTTKITDLSTGEIVEREFFEPEIVHWRTLSEAQKSQAEQDTGGKRD